MKMSISKEGITVELDGAEVTDEGTDRALRLAESLKRIKLEMDREYASFEMQAERHRAELRLQRDAQP